MPEFYVKRIFRDGVTSLGGPWHDAEAARHMAANIQPANQYGVSILERVDAEAPPPYPSRTSEKPLLLVGSHPTWAEQRVVIGPFRDTEDVSRFIGEALGVAKEGVDIGGTSEWQIEVAEEADVIAHRWPPIVRRYTDHRQVG